MSLKKSFLQLFMGNVGVQIITLAFYPILSRIYSPSDFGLFGIYSSTVLILGIFSTGQLQSLFPNPKDDDSALKLLRVTIFYLFIFSLLITLFFIIFESHFHEYFARYTMFLGVSIFAYGLNEIFKMWFIRFKAYKVSSISVNINRLSSSGLKVWSPSHLGLIFSEIFANLISVFFGIWFTNRKFTSWFHIPSKEEFKTVLTDNFSYPTILTFGTFCQYLVFELPIFAIDKIFDKNILGNYVLAQKLSIQAIWLVTASFVAVLHNKFVEDQLSGGINLKFLKKFMLALTSFSIPLAIFFHFFGGKILVVILGPKWLLAGNILSWLAPLVISKLLVGPILSLFLSNKQVKLLTVWRFFQALGMIVLFYINRDASLEDFIQRYVIFDFVLDVGLVTIAVTRLKKKIAG